MAIPGHVVDMYSFIGEKRLDKGGTFRPSYKKQTSHNRATVASCLSDKSSYESCVINEFSRYEMIEKYSNESGAEIFKR